MRRLRSLLPWSWTEREQAGSARPVSLLSRSFPASALSWFEDQLNEMNRLMRNFFETDEIREFNWRPCCQVQENDNEYTIRVDLPGVNEKDLKVELRDDNILHISAERRVEQETSPSSSIHFSEIAYGAYTRTFTLPNDADAKNINAELKNGVLTISIPKSKSQVAARTIEVRKAS
ncbi:MAG: Hsp20/alpha crystallin family protein [Deltaproteobacteria bacterium]|nr:Hsp20/alpha crystallin family protein [Deltaproteobacteria bacterium]MCX7952854.1 Hsp20/alpha crystallin family protein [Deltaproteobacteria bacterium]